MRPGISGRILRRAVALAAIVAAVGLPAARAGNAGPWIWHTPVAYAAANAPVHVTMQALCETPCSAQMFYRTTTTGQDLLTQANPSWPSVNMGRDAGFNLGGQVLYTFVADIPGSYVDSRGVDYLFKVVDGSASSWSPGTPGALSLGQTSGYRSMSYHVLVAAPTTIAHAAVATAAYRSTINLRADANCAAACSATLFFRRTGSSDPSLLDSGDPVSASGEPSELRWLSIGMNLDSANTSFQQYGAGVYTFSAQIPSAYVDTRGVDYAIRVTDGRTRAYWPGTVYNGYGIPLDGARVAWQHVHVVNPVLAWHAQQQYSTARGTPLTVSVQAACWTESCSGRMTYERFGDPQNDVAMSQSAITYVGDVKLITYSFTIPAAQVQAPAVLYRFRVTDGYTTMFSTGTGYNGAYVKDDGRGAGEYAVVVL